MALIPQNWKVPILSQIGFITTQYLLKNPTVWKVLNRPLENNRNIKHVVFIHRCVHFYIWVSLFYSYLVSVNIMKILFSQGKLFVISVCYPLTLYKLDLTPAPNNMRKLWEMVLESYGLPCYVDISVFPLFYPAMTVLLTKW